MSFQTKFLFCSVTFLLYVLLASGQSTTAAPPVKPTTTVTPAQECAKLNSSCSTCLTNPKCLYCLHDKSCRVYPVQHIFPSGSDCPPDMGNARWGVCWVNFKALLITAGVIAFLLLVVAPLMLYCCCCRKSSSKPSKKQLKEDAKVQKEREEREERHAVRKAERQTKYDDIRRKYGIGFKPAGDQESLLKDDGYERFDDA